jgi:hypothetical protein
MSSSFSPYELKKAPKVEPDVGYRKTPRKTLPGKRGALIFASSKNVTCQS